jgi:hypothetical protein
MAELLTFGQAKASRELAQVSGVCGGSDQFRAYLNQAVRKLMRRGNWFGTVKELQVCVFENCITWPRFVGTVLATNVCQRHVEPQNYWYDFLPLRRDSYNWGDIFQIAQSANCGGNAVTVFDGTSPVFNQIPCGKQFYIRAYPSVRADVGKTIRIFGFDNNGQPIRSKNSDGTWSDGILLTLSIPFATTPFVLTPPITRVLKDQTQGIVRLFQFDQINNVLLNCAEYQPSEMSPAYQHSRLQGFRFTPNSCNQGLKSIKALIKLQFVEVQSDTDLVLIDNLDAIQLMIHSIRNRDKGNPRTQLRSSG